MTENPSNREETRPKTPRSRDWVRRLLLGLPVVVGGFVLSYLRYRSVPDEIGVGIWTAAICLAVIAVIAFGMFWRGRARLRAMASTDPSAFAFRAFASKELQTSVSTITECSLRMGTLTWVRVDDRGVHIATSTSDVRLPWELVRGVATGEEIAGDTFWSAYAWRTNAVVLLVTVRGQDLRVPLMPASISGVRPAPRRELDRIIDAIWDRWVRLRARDDDAPPAVSATSS